MDCCTSRPPRWIRPHLDTPLAWAREWGRQFVARLCQTRDPAVPPPRTRLALASAEVPLMRGAEYSSDLLSGSGRNAADVVRIEPRTPEDFEGGSRSQSTLAPRRPRHLPPRGEQTERAFPSPFSRLTRINSPRRAGCSTRRSAAPCRNMQGKGPSGARCVLEPVRTAAEKSALIRELLESSVYFRRSPGLRRMRIGSSARFPLLEESGLIVKVPDWWKSRRPARPQVP